MSIDKNHFVLGPFADATAAPGVDVQLVRVGSSLAAKTFVMKALVSLERVTALTERLVRFDLRQPALYELCLLLRDLGTAAAVHDFSRFRLRSGRGLALATLLADGSLSYDDRYAEEFYALVRTLGSMLLPIYLAGRESQVSDARASDAQGEPAERVSKPGGSDIIRH